MVMDHRGRPLRPILEEAATAQENKKLQLFHEDATSHEDYVECVFRSFSLSVSKESVCDPDVLDCSNNSNDFQFQEGKPEPPRRSYDVLLFSSHEKQNSVDDEKLQEFSSDGPQNSVNVSKSPSADQQNSDNECEFRYKFSPTIDGFTFFTERGERKIDLEENLASIHLKESITVAVDESTRHCRGVCSALSGHNVISESDQTSKNTAFKNKLRISCSKQLQSITNVSRRLLSCPAAKSQARSESLPDAPPSQKMWKMCREGTSALKHHCREFERALSKTAEKTKQRIQKRKRGERSLNGFQSTPRSFESRQAAAQRLRELIQQKHSLNLSDRYSFHDEAPIGTGKMNEESIVFEPPMSWQETLELEQALYSLSMAKQRDAALASRNYVSGEATSSSTASPDQSTSTSSIEKLSVLLDQYLDQQTNNSDLPSLREKKTEGSSSDLSSIEKFGALFRDYFDKQKTSTVPGPQKNGCKIIVEDSSFHTHVKEATKSLSYSSGLTECSSEDSSIDCSAIVEHENNVTEQFGAYQADFDLDRILEVSMMNGGTV
ncbi:unnamed protein product [Cylindrotheca closterium]|uniref:Uncharacterized protein n=1 Tax=Cylindrotheca closterium TaxID=2856 RepID=A0AAD2GEX3_9STRA|nr:unnamed protein product [Cylindrotheca closterium]